MNNIPNFVERFFGTVIDLIHLVIEIFKEMHFTFLEVISSEVPTLNIIWIEVLWYWLIVTIMYSFIRDFILLFETPKTKEIIKIDNHFDGYVQNYFNTNQKNHNKKPQEIKTNQTNQTNRNKNFKN